MADIPLPPDLATVLADYERRLRALETAPRLQNSQFPWPSDTINDTFNTSSTTPVDSTPTAGPTVVATVSNTGRVLVTASVFIGLNTTGQTGSVMLFIDGSFAMQIVALSNNASAFAANVSSYRSISGLTPGSHTFTLKYQTSTGNVNFSGRTLVVQPY